MKIVSILFLILMLAGCGNTWYVDQKPETEEERQAVAALEVELIKNTPGSLAGHDQDWDDAIAAAHKAACKTVCKRRLYEYSANGALATGRMKEVGQEGEVKP